MQEECTGPQNNCEPEGGGEEEETTDPACALTEWSDWGECLPACGEGRVRKKNRKYARKHAKKKCEVWTNEVW